LPLWILKNSATSTLNGLLAEGGISMIGETHQAGVIARLGVARLRISVSPGGARRWLHREKQDRSRGHS
jgi:hypothetical protein